MLLQITGTDIMTLPKEVEDISDENVSLFGCCLHVWFRFMVSLFTHSFGFFVIFDFVLDFFYVHQFVSL
jgi:uncharacterized membrane protein